MVSSLRNCLMPFVLALLFVVMPAEHVEAATFTVTTTADSGTGSLRSAIISANLTTVADLIQFNIPGSGPFTINAASALPTVTQPLTIDGYTQPGAAANTLAEGDDAVILIRIDGSAAETTASGIAACVPVTVRGLSITGFAQNGIVIGGDSAGNGCPGVGTGTVITGNFIGLNPDGITSGGNRSHGIFLVAAPATIGGSAPALRNLISSTGLVGGSNGSHGIQVNDTAASGTVIQGNYIGTDASGRLDRGNRGEGVHLGISASGVTVGGAAPNRIAFNAIGIGVTGSASGNTLFGNDIFGNDGSAPSGTGIDLFAVTSPDGHTANDLNDGDTGGNDLQNHPVSVAASRIATGIHVIGNLDRPITPATRTYTIAAYASSACDAGGFGEGEHFLGSFAFVSTASTAQSFSADVPVIRELPIGSVITLTATDQASNSTSEFSACATLDGNAPLVVTSTADTDGAACGATCTLRQAINVANATAGADTIQFNLPGSGAQTIALGSNLPNITETLHIDGYSQPGASRNTSATTSNAVILVRVSGGAGAPHPLSTCAQNTVIEGLSMTGSGTAIGLGFAGTVACGTSGAADFSVVTGNFIGLAPNGAAGGNSFGIRVGQAQVRIGGSAPADRNVISGNLTGIEFSTPAAVGSVIEGNLIGVDPDGVSARGNTVIAVAFRGGSSNIRVGSDEAPNRIANNQAGVVVFNTSQGVDLARNHYAANIGQAIDLCALPTGCGDGLTANDVDDADAGANGLQNFPVLATARQVVSTLTVTGSLDVPAGAATDPYVIALYASATCDAGGVGENYLGSFSRALNGSAQSFTLTVDSANLIGSVVTATATFQGATSEFSACATVVDGNALFKDGFE